MDRRVFEMYRDAVDEATRNDIAAATAAHHELGRDYDGAVAESLVDRIGAEIDKRMDAKLAEAGKGPRRPAGVALTDRHGGLWLGIGIGSAATGIAGLIVSAIITRPIDDGLMAGSGATGLQSYNVVEDMFTGFLVVWGLLVVTFIVYTWVRHVRGRE